jgi:iron complex transport system ATP-binding protein
MTLQATGVSVRLGRAIILDNVSLTVNPREVVAVVGANGAGKSTVLRVLSGDLRPESGEVILNGQPMARCSMRERARHRAVLPQALSLTFGFTALEVVLMGRMPHVRGAESLHDYQIGRQALEYTDALHLEHRLYTTLSGGEAQRVQLARALAQVWEGEHPRYLLLDEPTNSLDLVHQHTTMQIARTFAERGVGVLAILHDLNLAAQYADNLIVMALGRILIDGPPEVVLQPALIRKAFAMDVCMASHPLLDRPYVLPIAVVQRGESTS